MLCLLWNTSRSTEMAPLKVRRSAAFVFPATGMDLVSFLGEDIMTTNIEQLKKPRLTYH